MPTAAKIAASTISGLVRFSTPPTIIPKIKLRAVATSRAQAANTSREQNRRDEQKEGAVRVQPGAKPDPHQKQRGNGSDREPIVGGNRLRARDRLFQSLKIAGFGLKTRTEAPGDAVVCHV